MGKRKGDSFIAQPPFEILIALVFTFLVVGFIIAQSGGINSILKGVCDKIPALCQGSVSTQDYETAKQSKEMLKCAFDTVLSGKEECLGIITENTQKTGTSGMATAAPSPVDASIYCNFSNGYPEIEYDEDNNFITGDTDDVWYLFDNIEWKWKCVDCGKNYYQYKALSEMPSILSEVDDIHKTIYDKLSVISVKSPEEKFSSGLVVLRDAVISGKDDEMIIHHKNGVKESLDKNSIERILDLSAEKEAKCEVRNFKMPETFSGLTSSAEEYINGFGDPSFLVYYQSFPAGEDADWSSQSEWFTGVNKAMFIAMCALDIIKPIAKAGQVAKKALEKASQKVTEKIAGKVEQSVIDDGLKSIERLFPELANKIEGEAILTVIKRDSVNNAIIASFKKKFPGIKEPGELYRAAAEPAITAGKMTKNKELDDAFINVYNGKFSSVDLSEMLLDKADPTVLEKLMAKTVQKAKDPSTLAKFAKYVGIDYGISYYMARMDSELGKFTKMHPNSIVLGMPLVREEATKLIGKTVIPKSAKIAYPDKQNMLQIGKPVVLVKGSGNPTVPFYLASPCMGDLKIETKPISCGVYTYNAINDLASCDNPDKSQYGSWWDKLNDEKLPDCGSLLVGYERIYKEKKEKLKDFVEKMKNIETTSEMTLTRGTVNTNRIRIKDPMEGIEFYYDKDNKLITDIGAVFKQPDGKFQYGIYSVKTLLDSIKNGNGVECIDIFGSDSGKSLCFDTRWESFKDGTVTVLGVEQKTRQVIKTLSNGEKGFICDERKIGENLYSTSTSEKPELSNKVEKYMMGSAETPDDTVFITCDFLPYMKHTPNVITYQTEWSFFLEKDSGKFYGTSVKETDLSSPFSRYNFVFKDLNQDGAVDQFGQYFLDADFMSIKDQSNYEQSLIIPEAYCQYRVFSDSDFNGEAESVMSTNCRVPSAVTVEVDKKGIEDENGNNYCYKSKSATWNTVTTLVSFGTAAFAKSGGGMVVSAVVDCGIMAAELAGVGKSNWPGG